MLYAISNGEKVAPKKGAQATCPICQSAVIPKCGDIKAWHWSHLSKDCDPWSEQETQWHLGWKEMFPPQNREVVIGLHRADVVTDSGVVVEFQHSPISPKEIKKREDFYGNKMIWVVDASSFVDNISIRNFQPKKFDWTRKQKRWLFSVRPLFFDMGEFLMYVVCFYNKKENTYSPFDGECKIFSKDYFMEWINSEEVSKASALEFGEKGNREDLSLIIEQERKQKENARETLEKMKQELDQERKRRVQLRGRSKRLEEAKQARNAGFRTRSEYSLHKEKMRKLDESIDDALSYRSR